MNTILVIDPEGKNLGSMSMESAEKVAENYGLDLAEVRPGVFKILDAGKLAYEASKRKQTKAKPIKDMKFKLNIGQHDFQVKMGHIAKFLEAGSTVRVTIWFSGREVSRPQAGVELMERIATGFEGVATTTMDTELQGKNMHMTLIPGKN